ncbi:unnamed protein product, partial [Meganyctiphanes norvegica]
MKIRMQYKMKEFSCLLLFITVLVIGWSEEISEECIVKDKIGHYINSTYEFSWIAFLSRETVLKMYVAYNEKDEVLDHEEVHIGVNAVYRVRKRNRKLLTRELIKNISLPFGWSSFMAEVEDKVMKITRDAMPFIIEFEYPVRYLSIISKNMAACSRGKPTWKIRKNMYSTIPLKRLENIEFSIFCNKSCSPILQINEVHFYLQYTSGIKIVHRNVPPLPRGTYNFLIKKETNKLIFHSRQV